jgi:hypothetical protein
MVSKDLSNDDDILVLNFNGWTFEGYDDAKTALIGTILESVSKHKTITHKAKSRIAKLFGRLKVMKLALAAGKHGIAYYAGGPAALGLSVAGDVASVTKDVLQKAKDFDPEKLDEYLKDDPDTVLRQSVREFRHDFEELIEETQLRAVVVVIDDLDRCFPDTIIETLEAIKLFLFVKKTAFLIGADERLVRYAVRRRFPELPGERADVGRDYLEKLIQFPVRIAPLGRAELQTYIGLLFAKASLTEEQFEAARKQVVECAADKLLRVRFTSTVAQAVLGESPVPDELQNGLLLAQRISPLLAIMSGYPRQSKRFLNALLMRVLMAQARGITLDKKILAKLMLLEYYRTESFRRLSTLQAEEGKTPKEFAQAERLFHKSGMTDVAANEPDRAPKKVTSKTGQRTEKEAEPTEAIADLPAWLSDTWIKDWLKSEPPLADVDLGPYFYFSRDRLGQLTEAMQQMTPRAQETLASLLGASEAARSSTLARAAELSPGEAVSIFESVAEKCRDEEEHGADNSALFLAIAWAEVRQDLMTQLFTLIESLPEKDLPVQVVTRLEKIAKSDENKRFAKTLVERWSKSSVNPTLRKAADARLKRM